MMITFVGAIPIYHFESTITISGDGVSTFLCYLEVAQKQKSQHVLFDCQLAIDSQ